MRFMRLVWMGLKSFAMLHLLGAKTKSQWHLIYEIGFFILNMKLLSNWGPLPTYKDVSQYVSYLIQTIAKDKDNFFVTLCKPVTFCRICQ